MIKSFLKKVLVTATCICMGVTSVGGQVAYAGVDVGASTYGFSVDTDYFHTTSWYNTVTTNVYRDGNIIGVATTKIGMTRAKTTSGGKYLDQVMLKCTMKGKNPKTNYAGYAEHLTMQSTLPSGSELAAYSPETEAGMKSYDIGVEASSDKTAGISASTSVTLNALEINNYCDTDARLFKECYDYQHHNFRWDWDLSKYSYQESVQRAHYVIKTAASKYDMKLVVKAKFERWDKTPQYWASAYDVYGTTNHTITFTSPR